MLTQLINARIPAPQGWLKNEYFILKIIRNTVRMNIVFCIFVNY